MRIKAFGREVEIRVKGPRAQALPGPGDDGAWAALLRGAGRPIGAMDALKVAAVFRCVDVIGKTVASLPMHLYRRVDGGKEKARGHPLYAMLHMLPNPHTTAYEFWHMYIVNLLLTRGAFAAIERNGRGEVVALWNLPTSNVDGVHINKVNGERYIDVFDGEGGSRRLRAGEYMYTPSLRFGSDVDPLNPIAIAADVLGLTADVNRMARSVFESGANPGGYIEHTATMSDAAYNRFKTEFEKNYAGVQNAGKWILLEEGAKAVQLTRDLEKTQALESRKFAVTEVCRLFGVPPHMVYDLERATFSNVEQQSIEFVQNCVMPMAVRLEQTIYKDALGPRERHSLFAKLNVNGLLRGDTAARTAYYKAGRNDGWLSADDIRELEDMNRIADGSGGMYLVNGNMMPLAAAKDNRPQQRSGSDGKTGE